ISLLGNEIGGLFLDPSRHGRGYGKALTDHTFALKGPLKVDVFLSNAIGRPFYERYGFNFVEEVLHEPSGQITWKMAMPGACPLLNRPPPARGGQIKTSQGDGT
ncbi:MAG: GNAT family N-acetyltransferase, partial [Leisingera sp.]